MSILVAIAVTFVFTLFDLALFPLAAGTVWLKPYRVLQTVVQIGLYAAAWWIAGWPAAAASALIWWTGGCDALYYLLGKYDFWSENDWPWLWWTPLGLIRWALTPWRKGSLDLMTATEVFWQVLAGIWTAITVLLISIIA